MPLVRYYEKLSLAYLKHSTRYDEASLLMLNVTLAKLRDQVHKPKPCQDTCLKGTDDVSSGFNRSELPNYVPHRRRYCNTPTKRAGRDKFTDHQDS